MNMNDCIPNSLDVETTVFIFPSRLPQKVVLFFLQNYTTVRKSCTCVRQKFASGSVIPWRSTGFHKISIFFSKYRISILEFCQLSLRYSYSALYEVEALSSLFSTKSNIVKVRVCDDDANNGGKTFS